MKVYDMKQGSEEWWAARKGVPTVSKFDSVITAKTAKPCSKMKTYMYSLIEEIALNGDPEFRSSFTSKAMQNGTNTEDEARLYFELETGLKVKQVGFCMDDDNRFGCSPDGLIGEDGGLELKAPMLKTQAGYLDEGVLPDAYKQQVHGSLAVTGRSYWIFYSYCVGLPSFTVTVRPDEYTQELRKCMTKFWQEWSKMKAKPCFAGLFSEKPTPELEPEHILF